MSLLCVVYGMTWLEWQSHLDWKGPDTASGPAPIAWGTHTMNQGRIVQHIEQGLN